MATDTARTQTQIKDGLTGTDVRRVIAGLFIALDGVAESPDQWQFDHFDEGMMAAMSADLATIDTVLMGRVTYQQWVNYWPTSNDEPYASHINGTPKIVVSRTLDHVEWGGRDNIRLAQGSVADEVARLKQQPGRNIGVAGSITLVRSMLEDGLLDQLTLLIHPVIAGRGKRLFEGDRERRRLELINSAISPTGVAILTYQPRRSA